MSDTTPPRPIIALISAASGLTFAAGLGISGMTLPHKVIGFLDVTGDWDPSLAFVMGAALAVFSAGYTISRRRKKPLYSKRFEIPDRTDITWQLLLGAALFGAGWGLSGFCPGPAIVSIATGAAPVFVFIITMILGMILHDLLQSRLPQD